MEDGANCEAIGAKAGAWIVDFKKLNVRASTIFDCRIDVVGVTG
jgi:hypothetical protein